MAIEIEDFPMKNCDFPWQNVSSPEGSDATPSGHPVVVRPGERSLEIPPSVPFTVRPRQVRCSETSIASTKRTAPWAWRAKKGSTGESSQNSESPWDLGKL